MYYTDKTVGNNYDEGISLPDVLKYNLYTQYNGTYMYTFVCNGHSQNVPLFSYSPCSSTVFPSSTFQ